jgi:hypothetical protein
MELNNPKSTVQVSDFTIRYYLRLEAAYFCKLNNIPLNAKLTPEVK